MVFARAEKAIVRSKNIHLLKFSAFTSRKACYYFTRARGKRLPGENSQSARSVFYTFPSTAAIKSPSAISHYVRHFLHQLQRSWMRSGPERIKGATKKAAESSSRRNSALCGIATCFLRTSIVFSRGREGEGQSLRFPLEIVSCCGFVRGDVSGMRFTVLTIF